MVSKLTRYAITLLLLAAALWIGKTVWDRYMESPWTRDGRIKADIVNISADVAGTVTDVLVRDNQVVQKGDVLFVVDKERYASALAQADAVLAALSAPEAQFDAVTAQVNALPEVAHNYRREHALNMWFVVAAESPAQATQVLQRIEGATGLKVHAFPKEREYRVELRLPLLPPGETLPPPLEVPHGAGCV